MPVLFVFLILVIPIRLTLLLDGTASITLQAWLFRRTWKMDFHRNQPAAPGPQIMRIIGTVLRTDHARRFLMQHIHWLSLQALVTLGLSDAARTALLTGCLQQLARFAGNKADIRTRPDFVNNTRLQARCILLFRLGTIVVIGGMVLLAWLLEGREHPAPKEA